MTKIKLKPNNLLHQTFHGAPCWGEGKEPLFAEVYLHGLAPRHCGSEAVVILSGSDDHKGSHLTLVFLPFEGVDVDFYSIEFEKDLPMFGREAAREFVERHIHEGLKPAEAEALGFVRKTY